MKILITGAAGRIATMIVRSLKDKYHFRGLDVVPMPELQDGIVGDQGDFDTVYQALEGMDAVMHLGNASGKNNDWDAVLSTNVTGTYNIFEAARQKGVRRIAYASRVGIIKRLPENIQYTIDIVPKPDNFYSISKVFGENLGYMYATRHDMEVVCVRIGNCHPTRALVGPNQLSPADAVSVFERAVIHPGVKYEIVYGVSNSKLSRFDIDHGRNAIGYDPQDWSSPDNE